MSEAEFSFFETLRGYTDFEDVYQGAPCTNPIVLSTQASGLDPAALIAYQRQVAQFAQGASTASAGDGISPFLVAGMPVPLGSLVCFYLPFLATAGEVPNGTHRYAIAWRLRSAQHFQDTGDPFHSRNDNFGPDDNGGSDVQPFGPAKFSGPALARKIVPVCWENVRYVNPAPTFSQVMADLAREDMFAASFAPAGYAIIDSPLYKAYSPTTVGLGNISQGLVPNPGSLGIAPQWQPLFPQAKGDECVLLVYRQPNPGPFGSVWDFNGEDLSVSGFFGRRGYTNPQGPLPGLGAYLGTGKGG